MISPDVSVVMSVYNGAQFLEESIESILSQDGVDFEFIIINDGSTDNSDLILAEYAERDKRVRVIEQGNAGLTKALIRGCAEARGKFIARQDVGDISSPKRLQRQLEVIRNNKDIVLISCMSRYIGPEKEILFEVKHNPEEATSVLKTLNIKKIKGPSHHGSTMFPRNIYKKVGGYRSEFYFAQDLDLWLRLVERGDHHIISDLLYEALYTPISISGINRKKQIELAKIAIECAKLRKEGEDESLLLKRAKEIKPSLKKITRIQKANAFYFIGMCLRKNKNSNAKKYFSQSLSFFPLHIKSLLRLIH